MSISDNLTRFVGAAEGAGAADAGAGRAPAHAGVHRAVEGVFLGNSRLVHRFNATLFVT